MPVFRTSLRILWNHKLYVLVYLVIMTLMGVLVSLGAGQGATTELVSSRPQVAVIDRDGSEVSRAIASYVFGNGERVEVADTRRALQDAAAEDTAQYVLVIPEGYGDALMAAAASGTQAPDLETVVSYQGAAGSLMDYKTRQYLGSLYGYASTLGGTQADVVAHADSAMAQTAEVSLAQTEAAGGSPAFRQYFLWCEYPVFTTCAVCIAVLMRSLNDEESRRRMLAAPTTASARTAQALAACVVGGLVVWAFVCVVGIAAFGRGLLASDPAAVLGVCLSVLAYALFAVAFGFLIGQLGASEQFANGIGNFGGMLFSVTGGVWIDLSMLAAPVLALARFTPSFWTTQAVELALGSESGVLAGVPYAGCIGLVALFAVTLVAVAFAGGRARLRSA